MKFLELVKTRKSVRTFKQEKVSDKIIAEVLEAAQLAPSAVNYQPWIFIVIDSEDLIEQIWQSYPREWFKKAPQVIVACGNHEESWKRSSDNKDHCDIDVSIAIDHLTLMAVEKGLGTCWVCNFNPQILKQILNLPENLEPIALIPIGYPTEEPKLNEKSRKPFKQIVFRNGLSESF